MLESTQPSWLGRLFRKAAVPVTPPQFHEAMLVIGSPADGSLEIVQGYWSDARASWCIEGTDTPVVPREVRGLVPDA